MPMKFVLFALAAFGVSAFLPMLAVAIEEPDFTVLEEIGKVEIREYEAFFVAQVGVDEEFDDAANVAFTPLFDYISGDNARSEKIAMTAPVLQHAQANDYQIAFVMPKSYASVEPPLPTDQRVAIKAVPQRLVASLRYSGGWSEKRYRKYEAALRSTLQASEYTVCGEPSFARFNPPFWPSFMRRNEIHMTVTVGECG